MNMKRVAAASLTAALLLGGADGNGRWGQIPGLSGACSSPAWAAQADPRETAEEERSGLTGAERAQVVSQGAYIRELVTDRSMYSPGETIQVQMTLANPAGGAWEAEVKMVLRHYTEIVWQEEARIPMDSKGYSFSLQAPGEDFMGYSLEVSLYRDGQLMDYEATGVDVSSDWNVFPRYGYVTKMDQSKGEVNEALTRLKNHHINGLFYYDVFDTQEKPLAGTAEAPADSWKTLNQSTARRETLLNTIDIGHQYNMRSFFYNLIFGAYDDYQNAGVSPEWGMYCDQRHQEQDVHDISGIGWETEKFWLMNPADPQWQDHYIQVHKDLFSVYPYDGIQVDSLGYRGDRYDYDGNPIQLDNAYVPMLNRLSEELGKKVIFNPVSLYGMEPQLKGTDYDIVYVEVWPGETPDFAALKKTVDDIYRKTKGEKGTVIAAYMNYGAPKSENFNVPSINYVNAVLMAAGASHLELGDTGMLSSEYYPGNSMRITAGLAEDLEDSYSFLVAYENLLRGTGLEPAADETYLDGKRTGSDLKPGNVSSFTKIKHQSGWKDREVLHLLNFDGASHDSWVDKGLAQTAPVTKTNVTVRHKYTQTPEKVWIASPDYQAGIPQEVPFTVQDGYVTFSLPYLEYYTMVVIE